MTVWACLPIRVGRGGACASGRWIIAHVSHGLENLLYIIWVFHVCSPSFPAPLPPRLVQILVGSCEN